MDISFSQSGSLKGIMDFLTQAPKANVRSVLESYAQEGVRALSAATPQESGLAARSWYAQVRQTRGGWEISWSNSDVEDGFPVAVMLQYGHGTGSGGYVQGIDYINPTMRPIFQKIADKAWKAVNSA